ncbi:MAG: sigma-70 family RNA polymerase sigma factor [bacterium]|nr:sigma-70 family RNA polymerase sigma factor [bacterium]
MKNEVQYIEDLRSGCPRAMGAIYAHYFEKVYGRCLSIAKNHADAYDCANDAILISFEKIDSFHGNASYATWLYAIASNYTLSFCKKASKSVEANENYTDVFEWPAEFDLVPIADVTELLIQILDAIPSKDRELLIEKYSNKKSIEELQLQFGLGASAIKMRLSRARQKAQDLYLTQLSFSA